MLVVFSRVPVTTPIEACLNKKFETEIVHIYICDFAAKLVITMYVSNGIFLKSTRNR
jgi:hypothetical protein